MTEQEILLEIEKTKLEIEKTKVVSAKLKDEELKHELAKLDHELEEEFRNDIVQGNSEVSHVTAPGQKQETNFHPLRTKRRD